jgi:hypothetical protein
MPGNKSVESWLAERDPSIRLVCETLRNMIVSTAPQLAEPIKWGNPVHTGNGNVLYLSSADTYASLGFFNRASLTDPHGRIEGTGKKMRHSKVRAVSDMEVAQLKSWVK